MKLIDALSRIRLIPLNGPTQARFQLRLRAKAKFFESARYVQSTARLSIGLIRLPANLTFKPSQPADHLYQFRDRDLVARTEVDRFALVIGSRRAQHTVSAVSYVKKLTRGEASPPYLDKFRVPLSSFNAFANQRRNHM